MPPLSPSLKPKARRLLSWSTASEEQIVSPEEVVLRFSEAAGEPRPARVDLLVSMVSADSGYRSLRIETVEQDGAEQAFGFRPAGARWIMVRLFPQPQATSVALGELAVMGHIGPPETEYAFAEAPARVIDVLTSLQTDDAVSLGGGGARRRTMGLSERTSSRMLRSLHREWTI